MIRAAANSVACMAVFPMQDILGLDSSHRMNTPGTMDEPAKDAEPAPDADSVPFVTPVEAKFACPDPLAENAPDAAARPTMDATPAPGDE